MSAQNEGGWRGIDRDVGLGSIELLHSCDPWRSVIVLGKAQSASERKLGNIRKGFERKRNRSRANFLWFVKPPECAI